MQHSTVTEGMVDAVHTTKDRYDMYKTIPILCQDRSDKYRKREKSENNDKAWD